MASIPKRVVERYVKAVPKFQKILKVAQSRDVNEADTVSIAQDILAEVFGYDKYLEVTSEYAIRGTYCDLAIKIDGKVQYLIEVKAIGIPLKENHLRQAVEYGVNHDVQWVVLTNGIVWELYRIKYERPVGCDLVSSLDIFDLNPRKSEDRERLFLFSKTGVAKSAREDYYERVQSINRFVIGALVLSENVVGQIRRDVRKLSPGLKVDAKEVEDILRNEVLKRDIVDGEDASKARNRVRRLARNSARRARKPKVEEASASIASEVPSA